MRCHHSTATQVTGCWWKFEAPTMSDMHTSTEIVFEAVRTLCEQGRVASRYSVQALTGLKMTAVDDRLKVLTDDGELKRLVNSQYEPAPPPSPLRSIKVSSHPNGRWEIDVSGSVFVLDSDGYWMLIRVELPEGRVQYKLGDQVVTLVTAEDLQVSVLRTAYQARARGIYWSGLLSMPANAMRPLNELSSLNESPGPEIS